MLRIIFIAIVYISYVGGVLPTYTPALHSDGLHRDGFIIQYFNLGYSYKEILIVLFFSHGLQISLRHLKRLIKTFNLNRRYTAVAGESPVADVVKAILEEIQGSGECLGYRALWKRLIRKHHLKVKRDTVLELLHIIDPEGVENRKRHRLLRRKYCAPGPNYVWHIDGYDKLKPFGFAIHGAIDGFSRRILWLEVGPTNNDPLVTAKYYLDCVEQLGYVPRILRCDLGTENSLIKLLQPFFRLEGDDELAGIKSFRQGKSTANQRIEAWWAILRKHSSQWWINLFKDMRDVGKLDDQNPIHKECLRYCFMDILQIELNQVVTEWNLHLISTKKNSECVKGKPDILYFVPEACGALNYGTPRSAGDINATRTECNVSKGKLPGCTPEFEELVHILLPNAEKPNNVDNALALFDSNEKS